MVFHQLFGDGPLFSSQHGPPITKAKREASNQIRPFDHAVGNSKELPERMSAQVIILLAIRKHGCCNAALGCSQMPVVEKRSLPKGLCLPTHHARGCNRDPIDASGLVCEISANFLEALAAEDLALPGNMFLALKAVCF